MWPWQGTLDQQRHRSVSRKSNVPGAAGSNVLFALRLQAAWGGPFAVVPPPFPNLWCNENGTPDLGPRHGTKGAVQPSKRGSHDQADLRVPRELPEAAVVPLAGRAPRTQPCLIALVAQLISTVTTSPREEVDLPSKRQELSRDFASFCLRLPG